jgi:hypothetical protein
MRFDGAKSPSMGPAGPIKTESRGRNACSKSAPGRYERHVHTPRTPIRGRSSCQGGADFAAGAPVAESFRSPCRIHTRPRYAAFEPDSDHMGPRSSVPPATGGANRRRLTRPRFIDPQHGRERSRLPHQDLWSKFVKAGGHHRAFLPWTLLWCVAYGFFAIETS